MAGLLIAASFLAALDVADAQMRRRAAGSGDAPPAPSGPVLPRRPFVGEWQGTMLLGNGPGAGRSRPLRMQFALADSARDAYTGVTIHPNDARAPHDQTVVTGGEIRWTMKNSGGGAWVYAARLVTRDSIAGTVILRDWPQLPAGERPPSGTFVLVRRQPAARGGA